MSGENKDGRPKKSLGQHFLVNPDLCQRIVNLLEPAESDCILEIGPGPGALSAILEKSPHSILLFLEKDNYWARERAAHKTTNSLIILTDAMTFAWERLKGKWKIIGNLPYNIASPLIWDIVSQTPVLERAVFMVQLEVAQRLVASPGSRAYGALSVWVQSHVSPHLHIRVAPGAFRPPPKVESGVLSFVPLARKPSSPLYLKRLLSLCFQNRRKQLRGIFKKSGLSCLLDKLRELGIDEQARPENLTPAQFGMLATFLAENSASLIKANGV